MSTSPAENIKVVLKPVKTAFTGQIMLLTPDDAIEYEKLTENLRRIPQTVQLRRRTARSIHHR